MSTKNIEQAIEHLKKGKLIIITDDDHREAEGDLAGLASLVTPQTVNFMAQQARGLICAPISATIAKRLRLSEMVAANTDVFGTAFTASVDHKTTSTGISVFDRAKTIKALADTASGPLDFHKPGHIFPLIAKNGGVSERRGHTEAAVDLARLAAAPEAAYICEILNEDGTMARRAQLALLAEKWHMPMVSIDEIASYLSNQQKVAVKLPTAFGNFDLTLLEDQNQKEHLLLSKGPLTDSGEPLLVRLHSECLTGDIFGSYRCDCGQQLHKAMHMIAEKGAGAILYLRQEGRGIGLKNKLKTYQLQEQGYDTYEANVKLGFKPDERDYAFAAQTLHKLGIKKINLLTNNPEKVNELERLGITVAQRIPLEIEPVKENINYLKTKKSKFHHFLSI